MAKTIFTYGESLYYPGKWLIQMKHDDFCLFSTSGNYNIICARLMNLSYANYLRFCRDILGAVVIGKGTKYPIPYFKKDENLFAFLKFLNARANYVLFEKEHPDFDSHKKIVEQYELKFKVKRNENNG